MSVSAFQFQLFSDFHVQIVYVQIQAQEVISVLLDNIWRGAFGILLEHKSLLRSSTCLVRAYS